MVGHAYGDRVIEPEIKLVFLCLFVVMVLADAANGHAVLPAFVLGLMMAKHYQQHQLEQERLRVVAFAFLTPFFFIRGGLNVSLGAVFANLGLLGILFAAKMVPKVGHLSFNGAYAAGSGTKVLYITERAVFEMRGGRLTLTEIAPGVDLEREVRAHVAPGVGVAEGLRPMDARIFRAQPMLQRP